MMSRRTMGYYAVKASAATANKAMNLTAAPLRFAAAGYRWR